MNFVIAAANLKAKNYGIKGDKLFKNGSLQCSVFHQNSIIASEAQTLSPSNLSYLVSFHNFMTKAKITVILSQTSYHSLAIIPQPFLTYLAEFHY